MRVSVGQALPSGISIILPTIRARKEKNWPKINDVQCLKVFFTAVAGGPAVRGIKAESVTDEILRDAKQ